MQNQILYCKHCGRLLTAPPERDHSEWVLPCYECNAKNILTVVNIGVPLAPLLEIIGVRDW